MQNQVSQREIDDYVKGRGYRTERIFNTIQVVQDGAELRVVGLTLIGPRGNRGCVVLHDGCGDLDMVRLWCDGVDYATSCVTARKAIRDIVRRRKAV